MAKNIIFCADGTWDGPGSDEHTPTADASNVLKLFNALAGRLTGGPTTAPEQERQYTDQNATLTQVAKYLHGVGDSQNWLVRALGGSLGTGLIARVLRGYTFISRYFEPPDDRIFLVGFSRGAYTARALGGLISSQGLLDWKSLGLAPAAPDIKGYQYAAAAWYGYQRQRLSATRSPNWLARLERLLADMPEALPWIALKPVYAGNVNIAMIAVWETVGALGIPELSTDDAARLDLLRFVDTKLSRNVTRGIQAIATDEQRIDFTPTLWNPDPRVTQMFFAGAHADLGGGYALGAQSQLSDIALEWMSRQLAATAVQFAAIPAASAGSELGPMHKPWTSPAFSLRPTGPREFPPYTDATLRLPLHPSIAQRLGRVVAAISATAPPVASMVPYVPISLANAGYLDVSGIRAMPQ